MMIRRIALSLFVLVMIGSIAMIGLMMAMNYPQQRIVQLGLPAGVAALLLLLVACRKPRNATAYSVPQYYHPAPVPQYFGTGPNDRPVMFHKGEPFDFVHNDPTAPDVK